MAESTIDRSDADALENPTRGADGRRSAVVVSRERERERERARSSVPFDSKPYIMFTHIAYTYLDRSIDRSIEPPLLEIGKIELKIHQTQIVRRALARWRVGDGDDDECRRRTIEV